MNSTPKVLNPLSIILAVQKGSCGVMNHNTKILFLYESIFFFPKVPVFIQRDIDILSKSFKVKQFFFKFYKIFNLIVEIRRSDVVFIWFAGYPAFIATVITRIINKPVIIVLGGYDVAAEKEIKYGQMRFAFFRYIGKFILKNARKVLAVSEYNKKECENYLGITTAEVVYNCVDTKYFKPSGKKEDIVISVGLISKMTIKRKGLDIFVKVAEKFPNIQFYMIGSGEKKAIEYLKSIAPSNVMFTGFISEEELLKFYQKAKVYCQLSYYESFGVSVVEAMACNCIPVTSNKAALPEVIGDAGFCTKYGEIDDIADAVEQALTDNDMGLKARKRVVEHYSLEKRKEQLYKIITETVP